jgi:hypothetical protein
MCLVLLLISLFRQLYGLVAMKEKRKVKEGSFALSVGGFPISSLPRSA